MIIHSVSISFPTPSFGDREEALMAILYENGFDNALIGLGIPGKIGVTMDIEANTREQAVEMLTHKVLRAFPELPPQAIVAHKP